MPNCPSQALSRPLCCACKIHHFAVPAAAAVAVVADAAAASGVGVVAEPEQGIGGP